MRCAVALSAIAARADEHLSLTPRTQKQPGIVHRSPRRRGLDDPTSPGNTGLGAVRQCGSVAQPRTLTAKSLRSEAASVSSPSPISLQPLNDVTLAHEATALCDQHHRFAGETTASQRRGRGAASEHVRPRRRIRLRRAVRRISALLRSHQHSLNVRTGRAALKVRAGGPDLREDEGRKSARPNLAGSVLAAPVGTVEAEPRRAHGERPAGANHCSCRRSLRARRPDGRSVSPSRGPCRSPGCLGHGPGRYSTPNDTSSRPRRRASVSRRHRRARPRRREPHPRRAPRHRPGVRREPACARALSEPRRELQSARREPKPHLTPRGCASRALGLKLTITTWRRSTRSDDHALVHRIARAFCRRSCPGQPALAAHARQDRAHR